MKQGEKTHVARRRVFYIPGYDPYPPRRYRELYRGESRKQAEISEFSIAQSPGPEPTGWTVTATIEGKATQTHIDVLIWHDLVQNSMGTGILQTYLALLRTTWTYVSSGALYRLSSLAKGPLLAALYPVGMLILQLVLALVFAGVIAGFFADLGVLSLLVFAGILWAMLQLFRGQDNRLFAYYLMQDYAYTARLKGAYPPEIEERLGVFRARVDAALGEPVDEVLIVGHSSGAQLAVSLMADILRENKRLPGAPALSLLTLGQVIPMVSFLPEAYRLRRDLRLLSTSDRLAWIDISAPGDGCCFALSDPVAVSGVAPEAGQKWPIVLSAAFRNTLSEATFKRLRRRYFRLHFQYLCAFDRPGDYDYFRVTAGPLTLGARFAGRASSKSRINRPVSGHTALEKVE